MACLAGKGGGRETKGGGKYLENSLMLIKQVTGQQWLIVVSGESSTMANYENEGQQESTGVNKGQQGSTRVKEATSVARATRFNKNTTKQHGSTRSTADKSQQESTRAT